MRRTTQFTLYIAATGQRGMKNNKEAFREQVRLCVKTSQDRVYDAPAIDDPHYITFDPYNDPLHGPIREAIFKPKLGRSSGSILKNDTIKIVSEKSHRSLVLSSRLQLFLAHTLIIFPLDGVVRIIPISFQCVRSHVPREVCRAVVFSIIKPEVFAKFYRQFRLHQTNRTDSRRCRMGIEVTLKSVRMCHGREEAIGLCNPVPSGNRSSRITPWIKVLDDWLLAGVTVVGNIIVLYYSYLLAHCFTCDEYSASPRLNTLVHWPMFVGKGKEKGECCNPIDFGQEDFVAHGSNVNCLALGHKSGRVLVTGGDDKKVNLWAVGKHNCIMSLSGHITPVECVKFGHTEEHVCAGSQAGALKIWDLEAAKIVRTLTGHKASIRSIDFHPYGDFLTSGSLDTSIRFANTLVVLSSTAEDEEIEVGISVGCIYFSQGGECLFTGSQDILRVYGWEPARLYDIVPVGWGRIQDIATAQNQLIGASFHMTNVLLCVVDLKRVQPFGGVPLVNQTSPPSPFSHGQSIRKSFSRDKPFNVAKANLKSSNLKYPQGFEDSKDPFLIL
uniref:Uncharacterized protein n=1 Tax=Timema cristinae TaxID=61476 RepID=A0A7R9CXC1_TIMCR|nr:unnamed protein product [Timema cristinae]